jgi:DNA-binding winged helix-turn-helix (wHTH) protein/tetratricopeptide (TPR) repeat protein
MRYRVGEHVLDLRKFELRTNDRLVPVEPQVLSLIFLLVQNRDRLVSKDELVETIWDGRAISDSAISSRIKSARQALGDDGETQHLIRTVHCKGFRFVGEVVADDNVAPVGHSPDACGDHALPIATVFPEARRRQILLSALGLAALLLIGLLLWRPWQAVAVTVAVMPATASQESAALARDLTAKLGMLNSISNGTARLLERGGNENADFAFQVDASAHGQEVETSLTLLNSKREVLWSMSFRRPGVNFADLKQQMAFSAAAALQCALDTVSRPTPSLDPPTLKTYLAGCAAYNEVSEDTYRDLRATFERVTKSSPRFKPGWKHLLTVETVIVEELALEDEAPSERARLERTIASAQRLDRAIPEIFIAQAVLLPPTAFSDRMRLADQAVKNGSDDPDLLRMRALFLSEVGRMREAVIDIRKAARLDPLSPSIREYLVIALASAGRIAEAREELVKAERLWPGSVSLLEARYLLELRFGDPKEAIRLRDSGDAHSSGAPLQWAFLEARVNPSPSNVDRALEQARSYFSDRPDAIYQLAQAEVAFGREDELFAVLLGGQQPYRASYLLQVLFRPAFRKFHHDPRMMLVAARLGLLQYWQSSGQWPDFCFDPDLPYDCKKAGAMIAPPKIERTMGSTLNQSEASRGWAKATA